MWVDECRQISLIIVPDYEFEDGAICLYSGKLGSEDFFFSAVPESMNFPLSELGRFDSGSNLPIMAEFQAIALQTKNQTLLNEYSLIGQPVIASELGVKPEYFVNLSLKYYQNQQFGLSIRASDAALEIRRDYVLPLNNKCAAQNELGEFEQAIITCRQALVLDPEFERAKGNLKRAEESLATGTGSE